MCRCFHKKQMLKGKLREARHYSSYHIDTTVRLGLKLPPQQDCLISTILMRDGRQATG
jgi:hypothetical protein